MTHAQEEGAIGMTAVQLSFFVLAVASIASAIGVITFRNAVHSALSLILTLLFLALFYLQLGAMFIAIVQILIYAGAIMVLFLFVVTMLVPAKPTKLKWDRIALATLDRRYYSWYRAGRRT